jgi:hypothetical protein
MPHLLTDLESELITVEPHDAFSRLEFVIRKNDKNFESQTMNHFITFVFVLVIFVRNDRLD